MHSKHFLLLSLLVSVISIFGDFVEKFLKRVANIENSSDLLPGKRGVLDRVRLIKVKACLDGFAVFQCSDNLLVHENVCW